jgi:alpha-tubulin suppressor-like RCC1 family protein
MAWLLTVLHATGSVCRDKKVCGIACGGIHNAVYTESGQVYTWGCSDDGSLGR